MFEAWKRSLDATIEVPDCEPAINAPRGKRERRTTPPCASVHEGCEGGGGGGVWSRSKEGGRDVAREGRRWKGVALSGCESSRGRGLSSRNTKEAGISSWLPVSLFHESGGERERVGREGGRWIGWPQICRCSRERKKGGKRKGNERERERERFEFRSLLLPRVLLRPGRDIGERCQ